MTAARAYRVRRSGRVFVVDPGSTLGVLVAACDAYVLVDVDVDDDQGQDQGAGAGAPAGETSPAGDTGTATVPTLPPVPPPAAPVDPAVAAILAAAYEVDTAEAVNGYLDEHPYAAAVVLSHERGTKARKGILEGRHAPSAD